MDVIKFQKEWRRMCDTQLKCEDCALNDLSPFCALTGESDIEHVELMVQIIEQWSKEHPEVTRQDLFLQQFPNTQKNEEGIIDLLPCILEPNMRLEPQSIEFKCNVLCKDCKHQYWTEIIDSSQDNDVKIKPKFNLDDYKGNYVMYCDTEEKAKIFLEFLHRCGKSWHSKQSYLEETNWKTYNKDTYYFFNNGTFGSFKYIEEDNYIVLEFDDFDWS